VAHEHLMKALDDKSVHIRRIAADRLDKSK